MAGLNVVSFRPERSDYAWTFGGVEPVMKVKPGDVLEVWTDDCFGGLVESVGDLPSEKITAFNPQTGLSRPVCPYPQYAKYKGTGNMKDAANWSCAAP